MPLAKYWQLAPPAPPELLAQYRGMTPTIAQVLYNRGLTDPIDAFEFLHADDISAGCYLSFKGKKPSIDKALARIRTAIKKGERIIIYGDFDADGVTSTALLVQTLKALGANVSAYIPHRVDEGYGLNSEALLKLARAGVKLVITVDCGIRSVEEVEDGKAAGLDIIITDHHSVGDVVPDAYAVINPKLTDCNYTEDMLAGVGVAYRLAEALLTIAGNTARNGVVPLTPDDLLDLVAIGTVADLAPLNRTENRVLVRRGLRILNEARRPGLRALMNVAGVRLGAVMAQSIGFGIGPRINAAGRLESAMSAYDLLCTLDERDADDLATKLHGLNVQRQELTREAQRLIRERIADDDDTPLIFDGDSSFQPGIVGLVAGRLTEEFFRPAVVMEYGDHESRASCRSIPQFDITRALDQCAALLVRHGGHAQAAGFTVLNENIPALKSKLLELARSALDGQSLAPILDVDMELRAEDITLENAESLYALEPTGHENPMPVFMTCGLKVLEARTVGREDSHLKLKLAGFNAPPIDAIAFNMGDWMSRLNRMNGSARVDIAYNLEVNEWNGMRSPQMNVQDIRLAED